MKYYCQYYNQQIHYCWDSSYAQEDIDENLSPNFTNLELTKEQHEKAIIGEAIIVDGVFTDIPEDIELTPSQNMLAGIRRIRTRLLEKSDWTQVNDNPLTDAKKLEWRNYRTTLRNITDSYTYDPTKEYPSEYLPTPPS